MSERITRRIRVYGIVQGVGFRPTVSRHAVTSGICGSVCNLSLIHISDNAEESISLWPPI